MPAVTASEFASYVQQDVDTATVTLLLALAEGLVVASIGALPDPASAGVRAVILESVRRAYVNPKGVRQEAVGAWSYTMPDAAARGVFLTGDDMRLLTPGWGGGAFSVRPTFEADTASEELWI